MRLPSEMRNHILFTPSRNFLLLFVSAIFNEASYLIASLTFLPGSFLLLSFWQFRPSKHAAVWFR